MKDSEYLRAPGYKKTYKVHTDPTWELNISEWAFHTSNAPNKYADKLFDLDKSAQFIVNIENIFDDNLHLNDL
jgi:hypothetical protein